MSAIINKLEYFSIFDGMESHPTWRGNIPGLAAEKLLRGNKTPFTYLIRQGESSQDENVRNYYVTFVMRDLEIKHQPLVITKGHDSWCYENKRPGGPYKNASIDSVIHLIMHCEENEPKAFVQ